MEQKKGLYARFGKRALDLTVSAGALALLWPLLLAVGAAVRLDSPGPALFRQRRVGRDGRCFEILKFRTMRIDTPRDTATHLLEQPERWITRTGAVLRRTSLDELPQLWNVLKGEMSLVGPRPALWNQQDLLALRARCGAEGIRPGLTGWAQINGRDALTLEQKARLDGEYARRMSLGFDLRCILGTIAAVARADGVVEGAQKPEKTTKKNRKAE